MADFYTSRPISPRQVGAGGKALWDHNREIEGRVPWESAPQCALDQVQRQAQIVLEAALPQDAEFLRQFAVECQQVAEIL